MNTGQSLLRKAAVVLSFQSGFLLLLAAFYFSIPLFLTIGANRANLNATVRIEVALCILAAVFFFISFRLCSGSVMRMFSLLGLVFALLIPAELLSVFLFGTELFFFLPVKSML